jgi:uncharacterized membrane protein HdeD (DUF308 family)
VTGIVSTIACVVVVVWPVDSIAVLTLTAGVWLVLIGITRVVQSFRTRREANAVRQSVEAVTDPVAA